MQRSYIVDAAAQLEDGAAAITVTGAGSAVLDLGGPGVGKLPRTSGTVIFDVSAIVNSDGTEFYDLIVQLADDSAFTTGVVDRAAVLMGDRTATGAPDEYGTGRLAVGIDNEHKGVVKRFMRLFVVVGGTAPSVMLTSWFAENQ